MSGPNFRVGGKRWVWVQAVKKRKDTGEIFVVGTYRDKEMTRVVDYDEAVSVKKLLAHWGPGEISEHMVLADTPEDRQWKPRES